jgi:muramoyltetrapeptide carboxypeptidase
LETKQIPILKSNDQIVLISTARKVSIAELKYSIQLLKSWGLKVVLGKNLYQEEHQFAGSVTQRTQDLQEALNNTAIKAVFFVRGGYGSIQVIDAIDWSSFAANPKWLIGFSDVSVFHAHIQENYKIPTLHAPMPITFESSTKSSLNNLKKMLFGKHISYEFETHEYNRKGKVEAEIVGGNLSILFSLLGSNSQLNTTGKILFIEDLDEYLYHIDRMMHALERAGMLTNLAGLLVGGMSEMNDHKIPFGKSAEQIIRDITLKYDFPIEFNFPGGHIKDNQPLKLGEKVILEIKSTTTLKQ